MFKQTLIFIACFFLVTGSYANPLGGKVIQGKASITRSGSQVTIKQQTPKAIINWKRFNIGTKETTSFIQPNGGVTLNRVVGRPSSTSIILGTLNANGKIILINPAGIYFGKTARVNVGSIIASTTDISNRNFMAGNYVFDRPSPLHGSVVNEGTIKAADYGLVALVGSGVSNDGTIQANLGNVVLASGEKFTFDLYGDQLVNFTVDSPIQHTPLDRHGKPLKNAVNNSGTIIADGGTVRMTASAARGVVDNVVNMSGIVQARSVKQINGEIILSGGDEGIVQVSGKLDASGKMPGSKGGSVKVLGKNIKVDATAVIDASGDRGGGKILIGGNLKGKGPERNAKTVKVDSGATLLADAVTQGDGGTLIIWSDDSTNFQGTVSAKGGAISGHGGFLETSGGYLSIAGSSVDLTAPVGETGVWLLDPADLTISNAASSPAFSNPYTALVNSNVNVGDLQTALSGANVVLATSVSGSGGNGDITVANDVAWSSGNSLTLSAYRDILLNANLTASGASTVNLQSDNTGTGIGNVAGGGIVTTPGAVNIYYNPVDYTSPTDYSPNVAGGGTLTAYMLINNLGSAGDAATVKSLAALSNSANFSLWDKNYALGRNIDASDTTTWNGGQGFFPIGGFVTKFSGKFDGQNHVIDSLFFNQPASGSDLGFFGNTSSSSVIQNLGLTNVNMTMTTALQMGALAGINTGLIDNSYSTGSLFSNVIGNHRIGGLVGENSDGTSGTILNSYSTASISDTSFTAGFVVAGGLVAFNRTNGVISNSYAGGSVNVNLLNNGLSLAFVGGLLGENGGSVSNSYSTANVALTGAGTTPATFVGGFVGIVGAASPLTTNYSTGAVSSTSGVVTGFTWNNGGSPISDGFWDAQTSGIPSGGAGTPLTTAQLQSGLPGLSFSSSLWGIIPNASYPYLKNLYPSTPRAISGYVPGGSAGATGLTDQTVQLAVNGADLVSSGLTRGNVNTGNNGYYYFLQPNNVIADNDALIAYTTTGPLGNVFAVAPSAGGSLSGLNMIANTVTIGGTTASNSSLAAAVAGLPASASLFSASGSNLQLGTAFNPNVNFITQPSVNFNVDGTIDTFGGGTSSVTFNGPVTISGGSGITTVGGQTYNDTLTITTAAATLDSTNGATINNNAPIIAPNTVLTFKDSSNVVQNGSITAKELIWLNSIGSISADVSVTDGVQFQNSQAFLGFPMTYNAPTSIDSSSFVFSGIDNAFPVTTILTNNGNFQLDDHIQTVAGLQGSGVIDNQSGINRNFTVNNTGSYFYGGQLRRFINFIKDGTGTLTLANGGLNDYTSTQVLGGTLNVVNLNALSTGDVTIGSGAFLNMNMGGANVFFNNFNVNGSFVNSSGGNLYLGQFTLGAAPSLSSNDSINLGGPIVATGTALSLGGTGSIQFDSAVTGALNSIVTTPTLTTRINNGGFTTSGNQNYQGPVTLLNNTQLTTDNGQISLHGVTSGGFNLTLNGNSGNNRFNLSGLNNLGGGVLTINAVINTPITAPFQNNTVDFSGYTKTVDVLLDDVVNINNGVLTVREDGSQLARFNSVATAVGNAGSITVAKGNPSIIYDPATGNGQIVDPFYFFNIFPTQFVPPSPGPTPPTPTTTQAVTFLPNSLIYQPTTLASLSETEITSQTIWSQLIQLESNLITQQMSLDEFYRDVMTVCGI